MKWGHILLHRIVLDLVANDDGGMIVEVETEGNPAFVTAIGMLDMARDELYLRIEDD